MAGVLLTTWSRYEINRTTDGILHAIMKVSLVQAIAAWLLPVLLAVTVHETAHGWVARRFGDKTAEMLGRLTLNPLKHIDPVGTILVPGIMLLLPGGFVFGWVRSVPVDWRNFKHPKQDMAWGGFGWTRVQPADGHCLGNHRENRPGDVC